MSNLNNISSSKEIASGVPCKISQSLPQSRGYGASVQVLPQEFQLTVNKSVRRVFSLPANLSTLSLQGRIKKQKIAHIEVSAATSIEILDPFEIVKNKDRRGLERFLRPKSPAAIDKIVNQRDQQENTLLSLAVTNDDLLTVFFLLKQPSININPRDRNGYTPLMDAAINGYREIVKAFLCREGIDIYLRDYEGNTAFMHAAREGHTGIVQDFLEIGHLDVNFINNSDLDDDHTLLMIAAKHGKRKTVQFLLRVDNININFRREDGSTALMLATCYRHRKVVQEFLKEESIDLTLVNEVERFTAMEIAAMEGYTEIVLDFLVRAKVNLQFHGGYTILMASAFRGHVETTRAILGIEDIDVNLKSEDKYTAIEVAASKGHAEIVNELLYNSKNSIENLFGCLKILVSKKDANIPLIEKVIKKMRLMSTPRLVVGKIYTSSKIIPSSDQEKLIGNIFIKQVNFERTLESYGLLKKECILPYELMKKIAEFTF